MLFAGLGTQYRLRRDHLIDCLDDEFDLQLSSARNGLWEGCDYYLASAKSSSTQMSEKVSSKTMFSFVPPTSGMFVWVCNFMKYLSPVTEICLDQVASRQRPTFQARRRRII
jgi:hypothetical protein